MLQNKKQHQESHQRATIHVKFPVFCKIGKARKSIECQKQNMYVYVSEISTEGFFVFFHYMKSIFVWGTGFHFQYRVRGKLKTKQNKAQATESLRETLHFGPKC